MKVAIIGASLSGLFTAYLLARKGAEVEVFEKGVAFEWEPRTLIVTSKLNEVLDFVPEEAIVNRIKYLQLFSRSNSAILEMSQPELVLERGRLLNLLAQRAQEAGAKAIFRHRFEAFGRSGTKILVSLEDLGTGQMRHFMADVLVGADGALSAVSQAARVNGYNFTALLQARVNLPENVSPDTVQVWFDPNQTKYFYWLIPESQEAATVGLIADDDQQAKTSLVAFLKERKLAPLEFQAATVPLHRFGYISGGQVPDRNIFFVGDAAAQVKVTTVGGVVPGLYGARALANALLNGRNYRKELRGLKLELDLHLLIRNVLNRFRDENYDELIATLKGKLREVLEGWTRDELRTGFLKLILTESRLVTLGAKALLRSMLCG